MVISPYKISSSLLLIAFFFSFSFNNIELGHYYFLAGQGSFFFLLIVSILGKYVLSKRDLIFFLFFASYCVFNSFLDCIFFDGICSLRPLKAIVSIFFIFLFMEIVIDQVQKKYISEYEIEKRIIYCAWFIIFTSFPDIVSISLTGHESIFLQHFKSSSISYDAPRLRGFTQEPSYLGMVISVIYPFALNRLILIKSLANTALVFLLWVCLLFTLSKTGIITCLIFTICSMKVKSSKLILTILPIFLLLLFFLNNSDYEFSLFEYNKSYLEQWNNGLDYSTITRVGHMVAALKLWLNNIWIGVGLGQSGFLLDKYYPDFIEGSLEVSKWSQLAPHGGIPTFSFIPKMLAELGFLGVSFLSYKFLILIKSVIRAPANAVGVKVFLASFVCFLISSFGVEGYLYICPWLMLAVVVGIVRRDRSNT